MLTVDKEKDMHNDSPMTELTVEETLEFLTTQSFGRLAFTYAGKPDIFPINFAIHANGVDNVVAYIRTSPGTKLFAFAASTPLALEADMVEDTTATSAVVYGTARFVQQRDELALVDSLGVEPQIAARKPAVIAIDIDQISGRRFLLGSGPETTIAETPD